MSDIHVSGADRSLACSSRVTSFYREAGRMPAANNGNDLPQGVPNKEQAAAVPDLQQVQDAVSRINEYVQQSERTLDFQLDEDSGKIIVRVYDKTSDELIRQIPSELALELAQKLNDEEPSLLFSAQV
jgi:flagellar protein FlaG